jgi:hypothetical protein
MPWLLDLIMQTDQPASPIARQHRAESWDAGRVPSRQFSRAWWIAVLLLSFVCFMGICIWLSAHRMMWDDEFDAWNLLSDPSWRHAFQSLNNGADSGPPLFYAVGRCLLAITGLHPVVVRLYSAMCFWLAAVVWCQILRRYFGDIIALAAVVLAFLCNPEMVYQTAQIRFYGELVLASALAVHIALWLEEKQPAAWVWFGSGALAGLLLVASHPLGLIYSAAIVFAQICTRTPFRKRAAVLGGTVLSWSWLIIFFLPVMHAAETDTWLSMPNAAAVVHFYNNHPLFIAHSRYVSVLLNLVLLCLAVYAVCWFVRTRGWKSPRSSFVLLFYISVILMIMPVGFAIVSHLYKPLFLGRYLLPYCLGVITLAAAGTWILAQRFMERSPKRFAALLTGPLVALTVITVVEQHLDPLPNIDPVLQLAQSMPTVIQYDQPVRQAHFYAPGRANNLFYILMKPGDHSTLDNIAHQGYEPEIVFAQPFLKQHREFLYVDTPLQTQFYEGALRGNPHWRRVEAGTVNLDGEILKVFRYTRMD